MEQSSTVGNSVTRRSFPTSRKNTHETLSLNRVYYIL